MIVVSNTSPLINLARISQLDLLHQLYGEVLIPEAVRQEAVVNGAGQPGANEIQYPKDLSHRSSLNSTLCVR